MDTPDRNRWWLVTGAGLAVVMAQLDTTIVNVALPAIQDDLRVPATVTAWVSIGYAVPLIGLCLLAGRWLDTVSRRGALTLSAAGFAAASVAAGVSPGAGTLIAARAVQGAFAAGLLALAPVLATTAVRPEARGRALGLVSTLAPLGAISGPALGGQLVETLGWPWIFYVNVPLAAVVVAIGRAQLPAGGALRPPEWSWMAETALLGGAAVVILLALSLATSRGIAWLALALLAPPPLLAWRRSTASLPVRRLLRAPGMPGPHLALVTSYTALLLTQFLAPFYLRHVLGAPAAVTGLTLLAYPAATAVAGPVSGALSDRGGARPVATAGAAVVTAGLALLAPLGPGWAPVDVAWRLAVVGIGFGLFVTPVQALAMSGAPRQMLGTTAATTNLARQLGIALGPAIGAAAWALSAYTTSGMRAGIGAATAISVLAVPAVARARTPHRSREPSPGTGRPEVATPRDRSTTR